MEKISFRKATLADVDAVMVIIGAAKRFMASQNSGQWQDQYPLREQIENDIVQSAYHVILLDGVVVGGLALLGYEADYDTLLEGAWAYEGSYLVIHRMVVDPQHHGKGLGGALFNYAETEANQNKIGLIRLDTHDKNKPMIALLEKFGYRKAGYVLLNNFKRRAAFEKKTL